MNLRDRFDRAFFFTVHRSPRSLQRAWQKRRLIRLVRFAAREIPLWQKRIGEIAPRVRDLQDLSLLPLSDKSLYLDRPVEEYIDPTRLQRGFWYTTSGTSGRPFTFLMSDVASADSINNFLSLRFLLWRGVSFTRIARMRFARIKIRAPESLQRLFVAVATWRTAPREVLERLVAFDTEILSTYPSLLFEMAQMIERDPTLPHPSPAYILSFGETLEPSVRSYVSHMFSAEVYDRYGLEEIGVIGVECDRHAGFHVNVESVAIEILDGEGKAVRSGGRGRIVATDLLNFNMPFIRYDTGDSGRLLEERCECGLSSPRLFVEGRYSASLAFGERRIHHLEFDGVMDTFMTVVYQYQIAKRSDTALFVRLVPGPGYDRTVEERVRAALSSLVGPAIQVEVDTVPVIPSTARGKSRIVVDESH